MSKIGVLGALGCDCAPGFYNKVLGPTADETILTGLQTLIDLGGKLRVCGERDESGEEEPEREQDLPEKDTSTKVRQLQPIDFGNNHSS